MRKHFGILTVLTAMIFALFVPFGRVDIAASGDNEKAIGKYTYTFSNGEAALYGCVSAVSGSITIPDTVDYNGTSYPVTRIRSSAFYGQSITSVKISKNIKIIDDSAFNNCTKLTSVTFDNNTVLTTIGPNAFQDDSALTTIKLPNSVKTIGNNAFWGCTALATFTFPTSLTSIGVYAFQDCSKLPDCTLPDSVTTIGYGAFYGCTSIKTVKIPASLTSLAEDQTVNTVGVFQGCTSLTTLVGYYNSSLKTIPARAFYGCSSLSSITLPLGIETIEDNAFYGCAALSSIVIPASIKSIGTGSFCQCPNLVDVQIAATTAPSVAYGSRTDNSKNSFNRTKVTFTYPVGASGYTTGNWTGYPYKNTGTVVVPSPAPTATQPTPTTKPATATPTTRPSSGNATPTRRPSATVTPKPTTPGGSRATATPTPRPSSSGSSSSSSSNPGVADFIERLYTVALGRASDPYGKADWVNRVRTQGYTGADLARGFLFSDEFLGKNMSDSAFLDVLYMTFFNRAADSQKSYWQGLLNQGWTKKQVIDGFINSTEWANLCLTYGIASGTNCSPNIVIQPSADVVAFAKRLYTTCLGRNPDTNGLNNWASALANMQISGSEAAHGFFFSAEFINAGHSDSEYVTRLYRTFMGREPDQGGYNNWMSALSSGQSREAVFQGFAGSAEWAGICAEYGILK